MLHLPFGTMLMSDCTDYPCSEISSLVVPQKDTFSRWRSSSEHELSATLSARYPSRSWTVYLVRVNWEVTRLSNMPEACSPSGGLCRQTLHIYLEHHDYCLLYMHYYHCRIITRETTTWTSLQGVKSDLYDDTKIPHFDAHSPILHAHAPCLGSHSPIIDCQHPRLHRLP